MQHSLFVSDLHLCDSRPEIAASFITFLEQTAIKADALYILGDLFEYWPGDDVIRTGFHQAIIEALAQAGQQTKLYLMHGNRDFLLGPAFARASQLTLLADPVLIQAYGQTVLLSHGDALCTDDIAYQAFRQQVRDAEWQTTFLAQPLAARLTYIAQVRSQSAAEKSAKSMAIMDVNQIAVAQLLAAFNYPPIFIHGHTHRPMRHVHQVDGHVCVRWVLGDWYAQGSYLRLDNNGCQAHAL